MTKAFDKISAGLAEARAFAQGKKVKGLKLHTREIAHRDVAAVRLKARLTQEQFAELIGASIGTVRKWETGGRRPSGAASSIARLAAEDRHEDVRHQAQITKTTAAKSPRGGGVKKTFQDRPHRQTQLAKIQCTGLHPLSETR
jgi:putative transcriptional regulator